MIFFKSDEDLWCSCSSVGQVKQKWTGGFETTHVKGGIPIIPLQQQVERPKNSRMFVPVRTSSDKLHPASHWIIIINKYLSATPPEKILLAWKLQLHFRHKKKLLSWRFLMLCLALIFTINLKLGGEIRCLNSKVKHNRSICCLQLTSVAPPPCC